MRARWWVHTSIVVTSVVAFMSISAWLALPWWEYAFLSDDSPVAWLSGALLLANAAVALNLTIARSLPRGIGGTLAFALAALAMDEQFLLHERFKESVPPAIGNLPTLAVGLVGMMFVALLMRAEKGASARRLFAASIIVGVFALWVDLGSAPSLVARLEEAFEVVAESLFLSALLEISARHVHSTSCA